MNFPLAGCFGVAAGPGTGSGAGIDPDQLESLSSRFALQGSEFALCASVFELARSTINPCLAVHEHSVDQAGSEVRAEFRHNRLRSHDNDFRCQRRCQPRSGLRFPVPDPPRSASSPIPGAARGSEVRHQSLKRRCRSHATLRARRHHGKFDHSCRTRP